MFNYIYLNKNNNLIDIRLKEPINKMTFHDKMEDLGIINMALILAWELDINYIKIKDIVGIIKFNHTYNNYEIFQYNEPIKPAENFIELIDNSIRLMYNQFDVTFNYGFLNYKHKNFSFDKAKIRCDVISSNPTILKNDKHQEFLSKLAINKTNFVVLASDSDIHPNSYKLLVPDVYSKFDLKYINILEKKQALQTIKPRILNTRSYCLVIYSWDGSNYLPAFSLYLNGSRNLKQNLKTADTEFQSVLYNCLPTPKFTKKELDKMTEYLESNDSKYQDLNSRAIAIDPPGSKDKDDAISFNVIKNRGKPVAIEMLVHISDVPPAINSDYTPYHFYYGFHKLETDYMLGSRYPMIDPKLSESTNSLSLIGSGKRAYTVKITYRIKPEGKYLFEIPDKVEMYLEKNIKIFATTYESIATGLTDYSKDLPIDNDYVVKHKLKYNGQPVSTLNPIPCADKKVDLNKMFWENPIDSSNNSDINYVQTQMDQLTWVYKLLVKSLPAVQEIKPLLQTKQYFNDDYQFDLREEWVHRLIEITAVETNKYAALILYDKISSNNYGISKNNFIGKLTTNQIKKYNEFFSKKERFTGSVEKDEGIFRALYYGVKGHNDSPKYVKEKYNQCIPANLMKEIADMQNLEDLPNLYLKFQLDKLANANRPLSKLVSMASFNQNTENLGIALYSTAIRPHLNSKLYYYTYFTSPMRRIVDTMVQTCLISDKEKCEQTINLFKKFLLNRMDINAQVEKYNLFVSVCNKIFGGDSNGVYRTAYIKYGNESFNNIFLPNLDITLSVSTTINKKLAPEGFVNIKLNQITEPLQVDVVDDQSNIITINDIIQEQKQLYFSRERYPDTSSYNYLYMNYKLMADSNGIYAPPNSL
jgi:hypothetical protein